MGGRLRRSRFPVSSLNATITAAFKSDATHARFGFDRAVSVTPGSPAADTSFLVNFNPVTAVTQVNQFQIEVATGVPINVGDGWIVTGRPAWMNTGITTGSGLLT